VADGEARDVALRLEVPESLVGFAEARKNKAERAPVIIDNAVSPRPGVDRLPRLANAVGERT